jgi:hypothetical protein
MNEKDFGFLSRDVATGVEEGLHRPEETVATLDEARVLG